jgi:NADPH:quinone reductase-like Zn-dependent oxidoreductase
MKAIVVTNQAAEAAGITLAERPEPTPAINDVVVEVRASGFVPAEWEWPSTWVDRSGHDRVQAIIGHEFAGVVTSLGYGTTGLSLGQRVFGITDWHRDGTLAEYAAVEARNLAPLPGDVDFTAGASLPISGLTAWQGLFQHGRLRAGQSVLAHGAAGAVGSAVTQLAREHGAYVIGTGRTADRQAALDFGANEFLNLDDEDLEDIGGVDLVFDVIGGDIQRRSASIIRPGGTRAFARTSEPSRPSTTPSPRSTRPSGARARPLSACTPERPGTGKQRRHAGTLLTRAAPVTRREARPQPRAPAAPCETPAGSSAMISAGKTVPARPGRHRACQAGVKSALESVGQMRLSEAVTAGRWCFRLA